MKKRTFFYFGIFFVMAILLAGCKAIETPSDSVVPAKDQATQDQADSPVTKAPSNTADSTASVCTPKLSGKESLDGFALSWNHCLGEDFQFYKLLRSTLDSTPVYMKNAVVYTENNAANASYFDRDFGQIGTKYSYRVCAIRPVNEAHCSNVVTYTKL